MEIIGHRGFAAIAPENTMISFLYALENGAHSLEFDLQLSADGVPVIFHDERLDRLTNTPGKIREKNLLELQNLDVGAWFGPEFVGQHIPTLTDALHLLKQVDQYLYFDIKPHCQWSDQDVKNLITILTEFDVLHKSIIYSFNDQFIEQVRRESQEVILAHIAADMASYERELTRAVTAGDKIMISEYHILLNQPSLITASRSQGVDVVVWTVDSQDDWQKLRDLGIERIVTNALIKRSD